MLAQLSGAATRGGYDTPRKDTPAQPDINAEALGKNKPGLCVAVVTSQASGASLNPTSGPTPKAGNWELS
jgi:hypothetical protein